VTILITGGSGFIGRHLIRHLLQTEKENLVVFDAAPDYPALAEFTDRIEIVPASILQLDALLDTIKQRKVEGIIHLAYKLGTEGQGFLPLVEVNCIGTTNVFEAAHLTGIRRVVYLSSAYVYPLRTTLTGPALTEDDPTSPDLEYGACKIFNEHMARFYAEEHGLDPIGLRLTTAFGQGRAQRRGIQPGHFTVLPELALQGHPITMPPDDQLADWIYAPDAAEAIKLTYRAQNPPHRIYNVSAECHPTGEITAHLRTLLPHVQISSATQPVTMPSLLNTTRLQSELTFTPKYSIAEALSDYLLAI
jgi:UDP-glucose 4-epimerase